MIGNYGKDKAATVQSFTARAIKRPKSGNHVIDGHAIDMVTAHTDGVMLSCEDDAAERMASLIPMFRMIPGRTYRITVEEIED